MQSPANGVIELWPAEDSARPPQQIAESNDLGISLSSLNQRI